MGFWEKAAEAAGEQYGKKHAERYERWEVFKRNVGGALAGAGFLFLVVYTYAADIGHAMSAAVPYILRGVMYVCLIGAVCLSAYIGVRYVRTRRRTYDRW